mgnify:CR=1 FL=1
MEVNLGQYSYDNAVTITFEAKSENDMDFIFKWLGGEVIQASKHSWSSNYDEITMGQWSLAQECKMPLDYVKLTCMAYCVEEQLEEAENAHDESKVKLLEAQQQIIDNELDIMVGAFKRNEVIQ